MRWNIRAHSIRSPFQYKARWSHADKNPKNTDISEADTKEFQEIMAYLQNLLDNPNSFERTWAAFYELPVFISNRVSKKSETGCSQMQIDDINRLCALLIGDMDQDCIKCIFRAQLESALKQPGNHAPYQTCPKKKTNPLKHWVHHPAKI